MKPWIVAILAAALIAPAALLAEEKPAATDEASDEQAQQAKSDDKADSEKAAPEKKMEPKEFSALLLRSTELFNKGDYAAALPAFKKLRGQLTDQPERLAA